MRRIGTARGVPVDILDGQRSAATVALSRGRAIAFDAAPGEVCHICGGGDGVQTGCCPTGRLPARRSFSASEGIPMDDLLEQLEQASDALAAILAQIEEQGGAPAAALARAATCARFGRGSAPAALSLSRPERPEPAPSRTVLAVRAGILPVSDLGVAALTRSGPLGLNEIDRDAIRKMNEGERNPALHVTEAAYAATRDKHARRRAG